MYRADAFTPIPSTGETWSVLAGGGARGPQGIKLYTFAYKFISNIHYSNASASTRYYYTHSIYAPTMEKAPLKIKQSNTQKTQSLQEIIDEFGPITGVQYVPFKCEPE